MEEKSLEELKEKLKRSEIKNYILEEENSILRENVQCLLIDFENMKEETKIIEKKKKEFEKEKIEIEKVTSGKIYKILRKAKKLMRGNE